MLFLPTLKFREHILMSFILTEYLIMNLLSFFFLLILTCLTL